MHLIEELCSGIKGAQGGVAELYAWPTAAPAIFWRDFEAMGPPQSGLVPLDSNGGATVYVNQLTRVFVKSAEGAPVRDFVAGAHAAAVEARTLGAKGRDYTPSTRASGKPTTLQRIIDDWQESSGSIDWQTIANNAAAAVRLAVYALGGDVFNVKSPTYGAVGNGTADDTTAIQAAIDAANASGGGIVVFPPGNYKTTAVLTLKQWVHLVGAGPAITRIFNTTVAANLINCNTTGYVVHRIADLKLELGTATGDVLSSTATNSTNPRFIEVTNCVFEASGANTGHLVNLDGDTANAIFRQCIFNLSASADGEAIRVDGADTVTCEACLFKARRTAYADYMFHVGTTVIANRVLVDGCIFDFSSVTVAASSPRALVLEGDTGVYIVRCNRFIDAATGVAEEAINFLDSTSALLVEYANEFGRSTSDPMVRYSQTTTKRFAHLLSRDVSKLQITDTAAANLTLRTHEHATIVIRRTVSAGAQTLNFEDGHEGDKFTLVHWNDTAALSGVVTFGATIRADVANYTVAANSVRIWMFRFVIINGNSRWVAIGPGTGDMAE